MQAKTPAREATNSMEQRTEGCIAILPLDNGQGSVEFLNIATNRVVVRDPWVELLTPDEVIIAMNKLAVKYKRKLSRDPTFILKNNRLNDDNAVDDNELINIEPKMTITDADLNHRGGDDTKDTSHDITINMENNIIDNINFNQESESIDESILKDSFTAVTDEDGDIIIDDSDAIFYTDEHKLNTNETRVNDEVNEDNVPDVQLFNGIIT